jgi:hypothetical protein
MMMALRKIKPTKKNRKRINNSFICEAYSCPKRHAAGAARAMYMDKAA